MSLYSPDRINALPVGGEGGPEVWSCVCVFEGAIADSTQKSVMETISSPACFVEDPYNPDCGLIFRVKGQMDEAVADIVQSLGPLVVGHIPNVLKEVGLSSLTELADLPDGQLPPKFDITRSVKAALGMI